MEKQTLNIFLGTMIVFIICCVLLHHNYQTNLYQEIQREVSAGNWLSAKDKLEDLGKYKDSDNLSQIVNYNFYLDMGNKNFEEKNYKLALEFFQKAIAIKRDNIIAQKINEVEDIIKKQEIEAQRKKLEVEQKQKQEQEKIQQAQNREYKQKLAEIEPAIKRTFYKIDFIEDKSLNARIYDFYIDPYIWVDLPYDVKESSFKLAVLYAKLKTNAKYSDDDYKFCTKIRNANTRAVLAEYTAFNGIKIKQF